MKKTLLISLLLTLTFLSIPKVDTSSQSQVCAQSTCNSVFKVLMYDLQPAGTAANMEDNNLAFVNGMNSAGYNFTHGKRATTPTITLSYLQGFNAVYFWNGCGGATGLFSAAELTAIRDYYLGGGNLIIVGDDANGDSTSPGNCYDRVNQVTTNVGSYFTGGYVMQWPVCHGLYKPPGSPGEVLTGITQSKFYSPSQIVPTTTLNWGDTRLGIIAQYNDSLFGSTVFNAAGFIRKNTTHGSFMAVAEREFLIGNQSGCAGQDVLMFWNNYISQQAAGSGIITCDAPSPTPTATNTPVPSNTVAPSVTPTQPPLLGTCNSVKMIYSPSDNPSRPPLIGDQLQLECAAITGAVRYQFQGKLATSSTYNISEAAFNATSQRSIFFTLPAGDYVFQCRGCSDATDDASCQPWE